MSLKERQTREERRKEATMEERKAERIENGRQGVQNNGSNEK